MRAKFEFNDKSLYTKNHSQCRQSVYISKNILFLIYNLYYYYNITSYFIIVINIQNKSIPTCHENCVTKSVPSWYKI